MPCFCLPRYITDNLQPSKSIAVLWLHKHVSDCSKDKMADSSRKPAGIPSWQRKQQPLQDESLAPTPPAPQHEDPTEVPIPTPNDEDETTGKETEGPVEAPQSANVNTFNPGDFATFKQESATPPQPSTPAPRPQQRHTNGPPIIMYPEHLEEAHKPPPLITPGRLLNMTYFVGGLAALIYGASKYLVTPMSDSLTDARHDFATHSLCKIDEMNEKLETLVSKVPDKKSRSDDQEAEDDAESDTSDPTELYHRDMGTQTSPPLTRSSSSSSDADATKPAKKTPTEYQSAGLSIMHSHLQDMLNAGERMEKENKERQDSANKLRHYLDGVMYGGMSSLNVWGQTEEAAGKREEESEDAVEELKKEIRGVKGVLLSAKRFPGVAGRTGVA